MKNIDKPSFLRNKYLQYSIFILLGLLLGRIFFSNNEPSISNVESPKEEREEIWTCAMHPQIKMPQKGKCPICGMDLILLQTSSTETSNNAISMSASAMKLAEIQTSIVQKGRIAKEILLYGKIQYDERLLQSQTAHVSGRIEKLFVNITGEKIKKGQRLAQIYSPELITAQKELLEAKTLEDKYPTMVEAAREKLRNWKLSDEQITTIESSGKVHTLFDIYANTSGVIINKKVNYGDHISEGTVLFEVADLSKVWAVFDAYESDLPWIVLRQTISFTSQAIPHKEFKGNISFIDPTINPITRIARVRAEIPNPYFLLKPEFFINGKIQAVIPQKNRQLIVPKSAVLWTGKRSIVYVKDPISKEPKFTMREVLLGTSLKDAYVLEEGLQEGEEIVTNGVFSVDAAAQLSGKNSMMSPPNKKNIKEKISPTQKKIPSTKEKILHSSFKVFGNCEMCKERIETAVRKLKGIKKVDWNVETKNIHLSFVKGKTNIKHIHNIITQTGHDTELQKADEKQYNALPECCQYKNK